MQTDPDNTDYFKSVKVDTVEAKRDEVEELEQAKTEFFAKGGKIKSVGSEANANTESKKWTKYNKHNKNKG